MTRYVNAAVVGACLLLGLGTLGQAQETITLRVVSWNMESGDSDADFLLSQMAEKQDVDIWGLSEVAPGAFDEFEEGAEGESDTNFETIRGQTGGGDRLAIIFNTERLEPVGQEELEHIALGSQNLRAPLVAHFRGRTTGQEFLVMVNHLLRGQGSRSDEIRRLEQARLLNEWGREQELPVIGCGDYNVDFDCEQGDAGMRAPGFDEIQRDGVFAWVRPLTLVRTQKSFNSVLDFFFVANHDQVPAWTGISRILDREGDAVAIDDTFSDDASHTDHRPVDAIFTMSVAPRPTPVAARAAADEPNLAEILERLERLEEELRELREMLEEQRDYLDSAKCDGFRRPRSWLWRELLLLMGWGKNDDPPRGIRFTRKPRRVVACRFTISPNSAHGSVSFCCVSPIVARGPRDGDCC